MERFKSIALLVLLLSTVAIAGYAFKLNKELTTCQAPHPPLPEVGSAVTAPAAVPIIDTYIDASGSAHAVIADEQTQHLIRQEALEITSPFRRIIDSQARLLAAQGVKPRDVEGYLGVQLKMARDSVRFLSRALEDGVPSRTYQDKYVTLTVRDPRPTDSAGADSLGSFDFAYDADLKFVEYSKQRRFLGIPVSRKKYYTDISSSDPRLKIKGVEKFTIQRREAPLGLRLQLLTTYNFETQAWGAGIGTRFDLGDRFNTGVNYLFNFTTQQWIPAAYAKYDLIQLGR